MIENVLTKRELLAAMAMQGMLQGNPRPLEDKPGVKEKLAAYCVKQADTLIAELGKELDHEKA